MHVGVILFGVLDPWAGVLDPWAGVLGVYEGVLDTLNSEFATWEIEEPTN